MKTEDLPLEKHQKSFSEYLIEKALWKINDPKYVQMSEGLVPGYITYYACRGDYHCTPEPDDVQSTLADIKATHLIVLMVENNKGNDFKGGGTINIHIYTPERSFEGYSDLYWSVEGVKVFEPMEWQAFEGSMGYFK